MRISSLFGFQKYSNFAEYTGDIVGRLVAPMESRRENGNIGVEEDYDQVDSSSNNNGVGRAEQAVSDATQTEEFDTLDCRSPACVSARAPVGNGQQNGASGHDGGLFSNLITMVLPAKRKNEEEHEEQLARNKRCASTQTEESPVALKAHELSCMVIQELALEAPVPSSSSRDEVFESLCCCVCEILEKHSILFNGMLNRFEVSNYRVFTSIANELFEATTDSSNFKITWGRVVSLFAFAVKLAQRYREEHEEDKIDNVVHFLSDYVSKHLLDFVETEGGWEGLVKQFPLPDSEDKQVKRAMLWSGLCVGLVATMYVSSFLSK